MIKKVGKVLCKIQQKELSEETSGLFASINSENISEKCVEVDVMRNYAHPYANI